MSIVNIKSMNRGYILYNDAVSLNSLSIDFICFSPRIKRISNTRGDFINILIFLNFDEK